MLMGARVCPNHCFAESESFGNPSFQPVSALFRLPGNLLSLHHVTTCLSQTLGMQESCLRPLGQREPIYFQQPFTFDTKTGGCQCCRWWLHKVTAHKQRLSECHICLSALLQVFCSWEPPCIQQSWPCCGFKRASYTNYLNTAGLVLVGLVGWCWQVGLWVGCII